MPRVLLINLHPTTRHPHLGVGYLTAALRLAGHQVGVLAPVTAQPAVLTPLDQPLDTPEDSRFWLKAMQHFSAFQATKLASNPLRQLKKTKQPNHALQIVSQHLQKKTKPQLILISTDLQEYVLVKAIAALALEHDIPMVLTGSRFNQLETINVWLDIAGLTALLAGESELIVSNLVERILRGQSINGWPGIFQPEHPASIIAPPLANLEQLPIPDFNGFAWPKNSNRIIPIITGRGCAWAQCSFCSDVTTLEGRSYRSRSFHSVLVELAVQTKRYQARHFLFFDLKLNSNPAMWHGLIDHFQRAVPNGHWAANVHIDNRAENGLDFPVLVAAKAAGLSSLSVGLESASRNLLRRMGKGMDLKRVQQFLVNAARADILVHCSVMLAYPGETLEDLHQTYRFLKENQQHLARLSIKHFKAIPGTRFERLYNHRPERFRALSTIAWDYKLGRSHAIYRPATEPNYQKIRHTFITLAKEINQRPLNTTATLFDGLL